MATTFAPYDVHLAGGITVKAIPADIAEARPNGESPCDFCFDTSDKYYIWEVNDLPLLAHGIIEDPSLSPRVVACAKCHGDLARENTAEQTAKSPDKGSGTPTDMGFYSGYTPSAAPPKCTTPHFFKLKGPKGKGWGYLRVSSERSGQIDTNADAALFFSVGWRRDIMEPIVELYAPGKEQIIPQLAAEDRSNWPAMAFIDWPDMRPPPPHIYPYVEWAVDQWKAGKNIQFACFGGHGRTGTFLALMLIRAGIKDGTNVIDYVHDVYCKSAIETAGQTLAVESYDG